MPKPLKFREYEDIGPEHRFRYQFSIREGDRDYDLGLDDLKEPKGAQAWSWRMPGPPEKNKVLIAKDIERIIGRSVSLQWKWAANSEAEFVVIVNGA